MPRTILHVNFSRSGGAGAVAKILQHEQTAHGHHANFHHVIDRDLRAQPFSSPRHTVAAGIDDAIIKSSKFDAPISLLRDRVAGPRLPQLSAIDIVHLHGINGVFPRDVVELLPQANKVVWTLHDMNPFTGACHYSLGCNRFTEGCSGCPAVKPVFEKLVAEHWRRKSDFVDAISNLAIVAPSTWLAELAGESPLLSDQNISVQTNPIDPAFFARGRKSEKATDPQTFRVVVVAKNLDDPVKNVAQTVSAFTEAFGTSLRFQLLLAGRGGASFVSPNIVLLGEQSSSELAEVFSTADLLVVSSLAENAPLVIAEAASQGCPSFVANVGGMPEMVDLLGAGEVFSATTELVELLRAHSEDAGDHREKARLSLKAAASRVFSPEAVVKGYDKVYS